MLKKIGAIFLALVLLFTVTACGGPGEEPVDPTVLAYQTYANIMEKLGANNRSEAVAIAVRRGIMHLQSPSKILMACLVCSRRKRHSARRP